MYRVLIVTVLAWQTLWSAPKVPYAAVVEVASVSYGSLVSKQDFSGTLAFNRKSHLAAQSSGTVTRLFFDRGDYVHKGALLLEIDAEILKAEVAALKADLAQARLKFEAAELDFKRYQQLWEQQSIAKQKYDSYFYQKEQLKHALLSLQANLKAKEIALGKKRLYAMFDGLVSSREVALGEWVKEGDPVALIIDPTTVDLLFHLPESYVKHIKAGSQQSVVINEKKYQAEVVGALLSGDANTRTFPLLLRLHKSDTNFFEGMQVNVKLDKHSRKKHWLVPRDAIVRKQNQTVIYIAHKGEALLESVEVLQSSGDKVAVASKKLHKGMKVVVKGNERLYPHAKIAIQ